MEQKKTLWIIAAVGVFLLVVLGFALIFTSSNPDDFETTTTVIAPVEKTDYSSGWSSPSEIPPALQEEEITDPEVQKVHDMFVVSENTTIVDLTQSDDGTTIDLNALKNQLIFEETTTNQVTTETNSSGVTVTKNEPVKNEATEYYVGTQNAAQAEKTEKATSVKRTDTSASKTTTTTTKTTTTGTKATSTTAAKPATTAPASKPVTRYWVQVASYTNKRTAENSRTVLSDHKISSDIYTYQDKDEKLFYRVRVGPFTTKSEAEYWMSKITQISEFSKAGSYVTSTTDK